MFWYSVWAHRGLQGDFPPGAKGSNGYLGSRSVHLAPEVLALIFDGNGGGLTGTETTISWAKLQYTESAIDFLFSIKNNLLGFYVLFSCYFYLRFPLICLFCFFKVLFVCLFFPLLKFLNQGWKGEQKLWYWHAEDKLIRLFSLSLCVCVVYTFNFVLYSLCLSFVPLPSTKSLNIFKA